MRGCVRSIFTVCAVQACGVAALCVEGGTVCEDGRRREIFRPREVGSSALPGRLRDKSDVDLWGILTLSSASSTSRRPCDRVLERDVDF